MINTLVSKATKNVICVDKRNLEMFSLSQGKISIDNGSLFRLHVSNDIPGTSGFRKSVLKTIFCYQ